MGKHRELMTELTVRFRDIDAMGHVNNAVFFTYFEEGRKAFLKEVMGIVEISDYPFILAHLRCDYLNPITLRDSPSVHTWIGEVGRKKFSFRYKIVDEKDASRVFATGESLMVLFDYKENKTVPIPPEFLEKLSAYRE